MEKNYLNYERWQQAKKDWEQLTKTTFVIDPNPIEVRVNNSTSECSSTDACEMIERILDSKTKCYPYVSFKQYKFRIFRWSFNVNIEIIHHGS